MLDKTVMVSVGSEYHSPILEPETHPTDLLFSDALNCRIRSRLETFRKLARTIKIPWRGIMNYHRTKMTTGFIEGLNSMIPAAKRKARGYRSPENLITIIYLIGGKLPLRFTHTI